MLLGAVTVIDDNTTVIPEQIFKQFTNLTWLKIKIGYLKIWKGNLSRELPTLDILSRETRSLCAIPENILRSPKLQKINGVTWSKACRNCTLVKNETHDNVTHFKRGTYDYYPMKHCRGSRLMVHVSRTIAGHGFLPNCLLEN
ncbi:uncharacterized protein LOC141887067 [Acropora palmata]|uniref:uncharacterized protein LOC141887067 n=1 Tax=Acropora palmata TaxID=6131 RepID=UPI003DA1C791